MSGVEIVVTQNEIAEFVLPRLEGLADADMQDLMLQIAAEGEDQTKRRIDSEKTSPDGEAWPANRAGNEILVLNGNLLGSIEHSATAAEAVWGSNLVYAAVHQNGAVIHGHGKKLRFQSGNQVFFRDHVTIPRRAYLGLSDSNKVAIEEVINVWIAGWLQ